MALVMDSTWHGATLGYINVKKGMCASVMGVYIVNQSSQH